MSHFPLTGGCQCGSVRYRILGDPLLVALCHCATCRRANAAPVVAWALFHASQVAFSGETIRSFASSPGCLRSFCPTCGSQIGFTADYLPELMDITVGSLDDPALVSPTLHAWESRRVPWLRLADDLPRHEGFPPPPG